MSRTDGRTDRRMDGEGSREGGGMERGKGHPPRWGKNGIGIDRSTSKGSECEQNMNEMNRWMYG